MTIFTIDPKLIITQKDKSTSKKSEIPTNIPIVKPASSTSFSHIANPTDISKTIPSLSTDKNDYRTDKDFNINKFSKRVDNSVPDTVKSDNKLDKMTEREKIWDKLKDKTDKEKTKKINSSNWYIYWKYIKK